MEELIAPPRTLDVQRFARTRATELLSLHSALKTRKRKALWLQDGSSLGNLAGTRTPNDGDGGGDTCNQNEDFGLSNAVTSLPRHLRRRTSSYVRRRRPLPWLYKKKKNPPITSSSLLIQPKKRRKQRERSRPMVQQSQSFDGTAAFTRECRDSRNAHLDAGLAPPVDLNSTATEAFLNQTCPPEFDAPMPPLINQTSSQHDLPGPLDVQWENHRNCDVIPSVQASDAGDISSLDIPGASAMVQLDTSGDVALENVEVGGAMTHLDCILSQDNSALAPYQSVAGLSFVEKETIATNFQQMSYRVHENGGIDFSQNDKDRIVSMGEGNLASPPQVASQATQQEVVHVDHVARMRVNSITPTVQAESHEIWQVLAMKDSVVQVASQAIQQESLVMNEKSSAVQVAGQATQQELVQTENDNVVPMSVDSIPPSVQEESHEIPQDLVMNELSSVSLAVDDAVGLACHTGQEDSIDDIYTEEVHEPISIDGVASDIQMGTFKVQDTKKKKNMCRALRRLFEFKPGSSPISSDGTWRLATHVWHAKRFTIEKMWGYRIPVGRHGRGHGSRSVLRWSKSKALLHDCSFINAIQLIGTEEKIMQVLRPVIELPQGPGSCMEAGEGRLTGGYFTTACLHHVSQAFHGIISPVIMMWKPVMPETSASNCTAVEEGSSQEQSIWLWVHAVAFEEAYQMLEDICSKVNEHMKEERVVCRSRKGDLGRLDLIGEGSFAVLQKVLFPIYRDGQGKSIKVEQLAALLNSKQSYGRAVMHLEVSDPRLKENERCLALDPVCISPAAIFNDRGSKLKDFVVEGDEIAEAEVEHEQGTLNIIHEEEIHNYLSNKSVDTLWACGPHASKHKFGQPVKEKFLSRMRHTDRLDAFGLTQTASSNRMVERRKTHPPQYFTCPVVLLKHEHEEASARGWSLVLPLSWMSAFWVPLVFAGGHVIGTRERHWLCTNAGSPAFPDDFPDCKAFVNTKPDKPLQAAHFLHKRINKTGPPMPDQICVCGQEKVIGGFVRFSCTAEEDTAQSIAGIEHGCFIARNFEQLASYLQMTHQTGLLLFPAKHTPTEFKGLSSRLHEGSVVWRLKPRNLQAPRSTQCLQAACLLRVCLRPFSRGVVKVGAKVYAPTSEDYLVWSCKEKASGVSVSGVRDLENSLGYVTSMAPRGSKISAAIGFCDAIALGLARQRQWVETPWHKKGEVFLMFCNEGSTLFRPAFASICIEAGPDI